MYINRVEICGVNTAKLPVISEKEKIALIEKAQAGDMEARDKMISSNLRLVLSVVQRFSNRGENLDDLFQVGCIGLIKAVENFDISQNVRFSTYAVPMIIGEIRRYLRDNNAVRVVMDQVGDSNDDVNWLEEIALKEAISSLNDREKKILTLRFFQGKTQMEVANEIGISQAQVSRLEKGALDHIKKEI